MATIEQNLERIADALEKIVAQGGSAVAQVASAAAEKPAEKPKAEAKPAEKPAEKPKSGKSIEDVRTVLKNYREIEGTPAMLEVLKKHGAANINELAEEHYEAVIAAVS